MLRFFDLPRRGVLASYTTQLRPLASRRLEEIPAGNTYGPLFRDFASQAFRFSPEDRGPAQTGRMLKHRWLHQVFFLPPEESSSFVFAAAFLRSWT